MRFGPQPLLMTFPSHRLQRGQSLPDAHLQLLRPQTLQKVLECSHGGWLSNKKPQRALDTVPTFSSHMTVPPRSQVGAPLSWAELGLQTLPLDSRACTQPTGAKNVDDPTPPAARSSASMLGSTRERTGCAPCDMPASTEPAATFHSRCCPHAAGWHPLDAGQQRCMRLPAPRAPDLWSAASRGIQGAFVPRMKVCRTPIQPACQPIPHPSMP